MRHYIVALICSIMIIGVTDEAFARRSSSSSFSRSSSRSYSRPSTSRRSTSTPSKRKSTSSFTKKKASTEKKATVSKTPSKSKPKAQSQSKLTKAVKKKNAQANKKYSQYGNNARSKAAADFKQSKEWKTESQKLASQNQYKSSTPPPSRPEYVPQNVTVGGSSVPTTYGMLPGGYYGYGYMDPVTGSMMALAAHDMMVTNAMLRTHGYGTYGAGGAVVVQRDPIADRMGVIIGGIIALILAGVIIVVVVKSISDE